MSKEQEKGFLSSLWDSFSSIRLTIPLLIILAVASIFGTLIPQNATPEEYLRVYKASTYKILKILGFLDMYHAGWFVFLLVLLGLNLIVCSLKRFPSVLKFFAEPEFRPDEGQWKGNSQGRKFFVPASASDYLPQAQEVLSQVFNPPRVLEGNGVRYLFAEKGKLSRLGFCFIHFSILVILAGAMIGSFFGYRGSVNIVEGETVDQVFLRSGQQTQPLGFRVKLEKFNVSFYPSGAPQEFKSTVTILEGSRKILTEAIRVNEPLTYKGISLYQSSYGVASVEKGVLEIRERSSGRGLTISAQMGIKTDIPGTSNSFVLNRFIPDFQGMGPAFQALLLEDNRPIENFLILQSHPEFVAQRPSRYEFRVREIQPKYYSGLQATRDPGVWAVWVGCFLLVTGFYMAFFMSHRRVWIRLTEKKGETILELTGSSHRNRREFEKELEKIGQALKDRSLKGQAGSKE